MISGFLHRDLFAIGKSSHRLKWMQHLERNRTITPVTGFSRTRRICQSGTTLSSYSEVGYWTRFFGNAWRISQNHFQSLLIRWSPNYRYYVTREGSRRITATIPQPSSSDAQVPRRDPAQRAATGKLCCCCCCLCRGPCPPRRSPYYYYQHNTPDGYSTILYTHVKAHCCTRKLQKTNGRTG